MKTWLITGSSRGLGRRLAEAALAAGDNVVATARKPEQLDDLVAEHGDRVAPFALDVTDEAQARAAVQFAVDRFGRLDVVANNAGYAASAPIEHMPDRDFREQFEANFFGVANVTRAALPVLRVQRCGHILQFSSVGGRVGGSPGMGAYQSAKFAVEGFSEVLNAEVKPLGIRVTIVEPGPFRTDYAGRSMQPSAPMAAYAGTPARATRDRFRDQDGVQPNDPARGAAAIIATVRAPAAPLRLPLGKEAVARIRAKLERQLTDMESTMDLALSTAYS